MDQATYESIKSERAKLATEYTTLDRVYRSAAPGSPEWRETRKDLNAIQKKRDGITFALLDDANTRHGDWRTDTDREIMLLIGWVSYRANCKRS